MGAWNWLPMPHALLERAEGAAAAGRRQGLNEAHRLALHHFRHEYQGVALRDYLEALASAAAGAPPPESPAESSTRPSDPV
jgi:hypothetical protein